MASAVQLFTCKGASHALGTAELRSSDTAPCTRELPGAESSPLPHNRNQRCCNRGARFAQQPARCPPTAARLHPCATGALVAPDLQPPQYRSAAGGPACQPASQHGGWPATHPPAPAGQAAGQEDAPGGAGSLSSRPGGMGADMQSPLTSQLQPGTVADLPAADSKSNSPLPRGSPTRQLARAASPAPPGPGWRPQTDAVQST